MSQHDSSCLSHQHSSIHQVFQAEVERDVKEEQSKTQNTKRKARKRKKDRNKIDASGGKNEINELLFDFVSQQTKPISLVSASQWVSRARRTRSFPNFLAKGGKKKRV